MSENLDRRLIDAIFALHGVAGPWECLKATGLVNRIYATRDVVLRVAAADHADAVVDARTESVAAPAAHAAGIPTPRLIAFDDSRTLVDCPFSLWERIHGETLGLLRLDERRLESVWRQVGRELARLHQRVTACPDPNGWLDTHERRSDLRPLLESLAGGGRIDTATTHEMERLVSELAPHIAPEVEPRFIHGDIHPMNIMCGAEGEMLALIDWGDAGWGDPTFDFAAIPLEAMAYALEGYLSESPVSLGPSPYARFTWDKLHYALEELSEHPERTPRLSIGALIREMRDREGW